MKALAKGLKLCLPDIVSDTQRSIHKEQTILDGNLVANELGDSRVKSGRKVFVLKLDIEKSYDHVDWGFMVWIMDQMGFGTKWRSWIECCTNIIA